MAKWHNNLLATTYALNASKTKPIFVGLDSDIELNYTEQYLSEGGQNPHLTEPEKSAGSILQDTDIFGDIFVATPDFVVNVKLTNAGNSPRDQSWKELVLECDLWEEFKKHFTRIDSYFNDSEIIFYEKCNGERCVRFGRCELFFGTSYGSKSVILSILPKSLKSSIEEAKSQNNHK